MTRPTASLCMIVKNEEDNIANLLDNLKDLVDEFIVVDTGSTDNTVNMAKKKGAKIYHYDWDDDFSAPRNFGLSKVTTDWVLIMDADEELECFSKEKFKELVSKFPESDKPELYKFRWVHLDPENANLKTAPLDFKTGLFNQSDKWKYHGIIHEQVMWSGTDVVCSFLPEIQIHHWGYAEKNIEKKKKFDRNIKILNQILKKDPDNPEHYFYLGLYHHYYNNHKKVLEILDHCFDLCQKQNLIPRWHDVALLYKLSTLVNLNEIKAALSFGIKSEEYCKHRPKYWLLMGVVYFKAGVFHKAIEHLKQALKPVDTDKLFHFDQEATTWKPHAILGEIYLRTVEYSNAYQHFQKAKEYIDDEVNLFISLARSCPPLGRMQEAKDYYEKAIELAPDEMRPMIKKELEKFEKKLEEFYLL